LHGLVGELYLWSAPLSHIEVAAIAVGFHPTYVTNAFLVAWYPLEEGVGDQLADITRNLPDATLRGLPSWQHELPSDAGTSMFLDVCSSSSPDPLTSPPSRPLMHIEVCPYRLAGVPRTTPLAAATAAAAAAAASVSTSFRPRVSRYTETTTRLSWHNGHGC
jgi:hypothetical protein